MGAIAASQLCMACTSSVVRVQDVQSSSNRGVLLHLLSSPCGIAEAPEASASVCDVTMDEASQQQGARAASIPGAPGVPVEGHPLMPVGNGRAGGPGYIAGAPGASYEEEQGAHVVREVAEEEAARARAAAAKAAPPRVRFLTSPVSETVQ